MPGVRELTLSWFWVVHLFWNKTPASSWSCQKQGLALRGRSLQELERPQPSLSSHEEQSSDTHLSAKWAGIHGRFWSQEDGWPENLGNWTPHIRRKKTWRTEVALGSLQICDCRNFHSSSSIFPTVSILVQNGCLKNFRLEAHIHSYRNVEKLDLTQPKPLNTFS